MKKNTTKIGKQTQNKNSHSNLWNGSNLNKTILRLIWKEHHISRAEVAKRLNLSRSTVTEIVKELLKTGLVLEKGMGKSTGGRRPVVLEFQENARGIIGIDIGATHVSVALTDLKGRLLFFKEERHTVRTDPEGTRKLIFDLCDESLASWKNGSQKLLSIGVAFPSPVDPVHPEWISEVVIPAWQGKNELDLLHKRYGVPVYIDNDANLAALAEYMWGAGRGANDIIYIKVSHGIGAGYILGGEIYRGSQGVAGEIGHFPIDIYGKQCVCGLRGCLVTFLGAEALQTKARSLLVDHPDSILKDKEPTVKDIEFAALSGDVLAIRLVREAAEYMGVAITSLLNIMNPERIILGGALARVNDIFLDPVREKIKHCTLVNSAASVEIRKSELENKCVAVGAATLALEEAFAEPNIFHQRPRPGVL